MEQITNGYNAIVGKSRIPVYAYEYLCRSVKMLGEGYVPKTNEVEKVCSNEHRRHQLLDYRLWIQIVILRNTGNPNRADFFVFKNMMQMNDFQFEAMLEHLIEIRS